MNLFIKKEKEKQNHQPKYLLMRLKKLKDKKLIKIKSKSTVSTQTTIMTFSNKINTEQGPIQSWPLLKQHIFYPTKSNYLHHLKNTIKTQIYPKYNLISLQKESILTVKNILFLVWAIPQISQKTKILILSNSIFIKTFYGKLTLQISFMSECPMIFKNLTNSLLEKETIPL